MSIIFYEKEHAEEILEKGVDKLSRKDLNYLAKYWKYMEFSESDIEKNLINFCKDNDSNFNEIQNYDFIHQATIHARHNSLRFPKPIFITEYEIEKIQTVDDYKIQKFLFAMLVSAKFFKFHPSREYTSSSKYDQYLYSNTSIKDLKELAKVNFTQKEWKEIKHDLTTKGLITPTIISSKKWAIGFWNEFSFTVITIEDYRNPIVYYQKYCGQNIIECLNCGVEISKRSNRHSYCDKCWEEKRKKEINENAKKYYYKNIKNFIHLENK